MRPRTPGLLLSAGLILGVPLLAAGQPPADKGGKRAATEKPVRTDRHGDPLPPGAVARLGTTRFRPGESIYQVRMAPDGNEVACLAGSVDEQRILVWDERTGKEVPRPKLPGSGPAVVALAYSPLGKLLAATEDGAGTSHLWDASQGKPIRAVPGQCQGFSPRGRFFATIGVAPKEGGEHLFLWEAGTGKPLRRQPLPHPIRELALSADGSTAALLPDDPQGDQISILDLRTGKAVDALTGQGRFFTSLACSPEGKVVASTDPEGTVEVWDARTGKELRRWRDADAVVRAVAFSPDGKTLALGSEDGRVRLWAVAAREQPLPFCEAPLPVRALQFSADGKRLLVATDVSVRIWDVASKRPLGPRGGHDAPIRAMALTADGRALVTSSWDRAIVWDLAGTRERRRLDPPRCLRFPLSIARDARSLALPLEDGSVCVVDPLTGEVRCRVQSRLEISPYPDSVTLLPPVVLSADGKAVALLCEDASVAVHDTASGKLLGRTGKPKQGQEWEGSFLSMTLSPHGTFLLGARVLPFIGTHHFLYEVKSGQQFRPLGRERFSSGLQGAFDISPDGRALVGGWLRRDLERWDLAARRALPALTGAQSEVTGLFFSPDGKYVGSCGREQARDEPSSVDFPGLRVWDWKTGRLLPHLGRAQGPAHAACFSPDNRLLAVLHADGSLRLWESATGKERACLAVGLPRTAFEVPPLFTPDGRLLLTADGPTVLLWDLTCREARAAVPRLAK
jgi:WD40 repeat protein